MCRLSGEKKKEKRKEKRATECLPKAVRQLSRRPWRLHVRPAQFQSPNSFHTQPYLHTIQQAPWQATSELIHNSKDGQKCHCPPIPSLTPMGPLVLHTKLGCLGGIRGAGVGAEPSSLPKDTHPSVTSRSRGLWCECPKIPKLGDTPPAPYLPSEERDLESTGRTILVHAAKPRRAGVGTEYPGDDARSSFSHPLGTHAPFSERSVGSSG